MSFKASNKAVEHVSAQSGSFGTEAKENREVLKMASYFKIED